jgi:DNA-binding CsgD family transcriptional regulator
MERAAARRAGPLRPVPRRDRTEGFQREVGDALAHLHDPAWLQTHPLLRFVRGTRPDDPRVGGTLRTALLEALATVGAEPAGARLQRLLTRRYVDGLNAPGVQAELAIAKSEYYRQHTRALAALAAALRERWADAPAATATAAPAMTQPEHPLALGPPAAFRTPFVARGLELTALRERLALARRAAGGLVLIAGEPGIGKTRLIAEVAEQARTEGWLVLVGRSYDADGMPPYLPIGEALRAYVRTCPLAQLRAEIAEAGPDVALIVPEIRGRLADLPASQPVSPKHGRYRLFESVAEFLRGSARSRADSAGLLLVLDDLHWADTPTLLLLQHLARRLVDAPMLVLGSYRTVDPRPAHGLQDVLADLGREHLYESVLLAPFSREEAGDLIRELNGAPAAPAVVDAIQQDTQGNPFLIEEVARQLRTEVGNLADPRTIGLHRTVPDSVRQVVGRRLARLGAAANWLLRVAAVLGDGFRFDVLAAASGIEVASLVDALEEALAAGVLREDGGRYHFAHALLREALHEELSAPRCARLHHQIGEAMERLHAGNPEPHLGELAHHFCEAGGIEDLAKAVAYARLAGDRALGLFALEEAARLYELGLRALGIADAADHASTCELLLALGEARRRAGELQAAMEAFSRAADIARVRKEPEPLACAALGYEDALLPTGRLRAGHADPSITLLEEALRALPPVDSPLRARLLAGLARALHFARAPERAAALNDEAVGMARRVGDIDALAYALDARCMAIWVSADLEEQVAAATELAELAERVHDRELALEGRRWRFLALLGLGDAVSADAEIDAYARTAEALRLPQHLANVPLWRAARALLDGRYDEVEGLARQALAARRRAQSIEADLNFTSQMLALHHDLGDLEGLAELEANAREIAGNDRYPRGPAWRTHLIRLGIAFDRRDEVRVELERLAANRFATIPRTLTWLGALAGLAEACAYLGDAGRGAVLYEIMRPYDNRMIVHGSAEVCRGPVSHYLGLLAATARHWEDASNHFETAAQLADRVGARPALARAVEAHAAMLLARHRREDRPRARELLSQALAIYHELGTRPHVTRVSALLTDRWLAQMLAAPVHPGGLTHQEVEVLRLIAGGRSNREIADALVLSVRTVERHVTNIYRKIDARGRADATAFAITRGLMDRRTT